MTINYGRTSSHAAGKAPLLNCACYKAPRAAASTRCRNFLTRLRPKRRKNTGLEEAMSSNIELAHQFRMYDPKGIQTLMATQAALSTADPRTLAQMTRASGYAVPAHYWPWASILAASFCRALRWLEPV